MKEKFELLKKFIADMVDGPVKEAFKKMASLAYDIWQHAKTSDVVGWKLAQIVCGDDPEKLADFAAIITGGGEVTSADMRMFARLQAEVAELRKVNASAEAIRQHVVGLLKDPAFRTSLQEVGEILRGEGAPHAC